VGNYKVEMFFNTASVVSESNTQAMDVTMDIGF
jgi:hypothetical protein